MSVCEVCGVLVTKARSGRFVHLDDIPDGINPDHWIISVDASDFREGAEKRLTLKGAAEDMLLHHATLHPVKGCEWAEVLLRALKQS